MGVGLRSVFSGALISAFAQAWLPTPICAGAGLSAAIFPVRLICLRNRLDHPTNPAVLRDVASPRRLNSSSGKDLHLDFSRSKREPGADGLRSLHCAVGRCLACYAQLALPRNGSQHATGAAHFANPAHPQKKRDQFPDRAHFILV